MGAPRELVSGATDAPLPTRRICSRGPGRRPGPAVPSDAGNGAAPLPFTTASPCGDRSRGGGRSPTTTGPTPPGTASASRGGRWGSRAFFFCNGCVVSASVLPQDGCNLPPIAMYGAVRRARPKTERKTPRRDRFLTPPEGLPNPGQALRLSKSLMYAGFSSCPLLVGPGLPSPVLPDRPAGGARRPGRSSWEPLRGRSIL